MVPPLFIATEPFGPSNGQKWESYCLWAKIPGLVELVCLDSMLCPHLATERKAEDWDHVVCEDFRLDYFYDLDYLMRRVQQVPRRNILGLYRNPENHVVAAPASGDFCFLGYDLIEEKTQISALTNCGGFPDVFRNDELDYFGLIDSFDRACEVRRTLSVHHPNEQHAQCEMYAVWRLHETE